MEIMNKKTLPEKTAEHPDLRKWQHIFQKTGQAAFRCNSLLNNIRHEYYKEKRITKKARQVTDEKKKLTHSQRLSFTRQRISVKGEGELLE